LIFALIGNQNSGKTTLFNQLTGSNQHVGNFPGVTVEKKEGSVRSHKEIKIIDLPGIYSLSPYTAEEVVTRDFLIQNKPDGIINIVDATNIERNLYLTLQLLELDIPVVLALNMMDEVRSSGGAINVAKMAKALNIPIVPIVANKNEGVQDLIVQAVQSVKDGPAEKRLDFCKGSVHKAIHSIAHLIETKARQRQIPVRFAATKLVEGDEPMIRSLDLAENDLHIIEHIAQEMEKELNTDREAALADMRYDFIEEVVASTVIKPEKSRERSRSDKLDRFLTDKYLALPLFLVIMMTMFWLTFNVIGAWLSDSLALVIDGITASVDLWLGRMQVADWMHSLLIDGVFAGVGSVLSFLPIIVVLFFFLSIIEDSGYMARVAFVMDKLLRKIGLSGRSFVPLLIGFGCSVPAIMSSRTLSSRRDQVMTIILTPFISCSAKLPIYGLFIAAFFADHQPLVFVSLYVMGIVVAIIVGLILKNTIFRGNPVPFVMELPVYRFPDIKSVMIHMWEKAKDFLIKAFTIIFVATIVIWFFSSFDFRFNLVADSSDSILASFGRLIAPLFIPLGFGNWQSATSLIVGLTAKEAVISTLAVLLGTGDLELGTILPQFFTPLTAFSFLTFVLLYMPCVAAMAAIRRELGSVWKAALVMLFQTSVAWVVSFMVYNIGKIIVAASLNTVDLALIAVVALLVILALAYMIKQRNTSPCGGCTACSNCAMRGQCADEKK
jgi:ferrous iron transport protein B